MATRYEQFATRTNDCELQYERWERSLLRSHSPATAESSPDATYREAGRGFPIPQCPGGATPTRAQSLTPRTFARWTMDTLGFLGTCPSNGRRRALARS